MDGCDEAGTQQKRQLNQSGGHRAVCHSERSEESLFLRQANGLRMTSEEPALPSTPLRDSERSRTVSEANGARHDNFTARERRGTGMTAFNYLKRQAG